MRLTIPLRVRISKRMADSLAATSSNTSAATRAYLLLGMACAGEDLHAFRGELAGLLAEELRPHLLATLEQHHLGLLAHGSSLPPGAGSTPVFPRSPIVPTLHEEPAQPLRATSLATGSWDDAYEV